MSRSRRQRDSVAPSLFPFLAVLLCTMGALVLILMLIVAGAQATARQIATESEQQVEEVENQLQLASYAYRKQLTAGQLDLEKKRLALQHLENHIRELLDEMERLQRTGELAQQDALTDEASRQAQDAVLSQLEKQLSEASEKLKQKLAKPSGDKPIFAILPYDGPHGTHRRPIYLECTEAGIKIQPEGILLEQSDLEPPYGPGNPLDAALRTIRSQYVPANQALTSTAYPLLIVRPSGIRTYAMARAAMSGWDDQFGYELIGEELELTFPEGEPGLKNKIAQALALARQRQAALIMAMPQKYRQFSDRDQPLGSMSRDGSEAYGAANLGDASRANWSGDAGTEGGPLGEFSMIGSKGEAGGRERGAAMGFGAGTGDALPSGVLPNGNGASHGDLGHGDLGLKNYGQTSDGNGSFEREAGGSYGDHPQPLGDSFFGSQGSRGIAGNESIYGENGTSHSGVSGDDALHDGHGSGSGGNWSGTTQSNGSGGGAQSMSMSGSQIAIPIGAPGSQGSLQDGSSGQAGSAPSAGNPAADGGSNAFSLSHSLAPSKTASESSPPVAHRRGRGWAWSQGPPTQTPVVRSVRMQCLSDRWIVLPDLGSSGGDSVTIAFDDAPQIRAEKLAKLIAERVDSWGLALTGGYWKPVLVVDVAPDAAWRFEQLKQLLDGSGLEVQRRSSN